MNSFDERAAQWDENPERLIRAQDAARSIRNHVPLDSTWTAMEYGCGTGLVGFLLQPFLGHLVMADSSSGMLAVLQEKIDRAGVTNMTCLKLDLATDPAPSQLFQLIFTSMTLHHVADTLGLLKRFYDLLADGGYLAVVDLDAEDGWFHGEDFTGHKGFDRAVLKDRVHQAGFVNAIYHDLAPLTKNTLVGMRTFPLFLLVAHK
ncbi:MAG TPA: class I SAM-dependent methyltransferase [bacterium]|nr:class I SAM-dependent methyltransferase [bacterium]HPN33395.1 class I SAM-dependent methyltransferase [bacterium]